MADNHVKFAEGTHLEPDTLHVADGGTHNLPEAHIGMLKNHHTYRADLPVKHTLGADVLAEVPNYNLYVRVAGMQPTTVEGDLYTTLVQLEVKTIKEGRIREKLFLKNSKEENMEILVTAQVMESGQGNPLLKNGVHLISHEVEDESEWPGHSSH